MTLVVGMVVVIFVGVPMALGPVVWLRLAGQG